MGLFDVFSKGGKYFGKAIEPKCEYCEHGKRTKDGDKVLCNKKGMVDASFHCPKFQYSPLKRIPVKQMNLVGFLEGDYDEKNDDEPPKPAAKPASSASSSAPAAPAAKPAKPAPAPAPAAKPETSATAEPAPAPAAPEAKPETSAAAEPAPAPAPKPTVSGAADLAALAAAADAAGEYKPEEEAADPAETTGLSDM